MTRNSDDGFGLFRGLLFALPIGLLLWLLILCVAIKVLG